MGALSLIQNSVFRLGLLAILGLCLHQDSRAGRRGSPKAVSAVASAWDAPALYTFKFYFVDCNQHTYLNRSIRRSMFNKQNMPLS